MLQLGNREISAVIFDMDGTMFDTERLRFETIRRASTEITGHPIAEETLIGSLGLGIPKAEALARDHNGTSYPYREIRARADTLELAHVRAQGVPVKPGLREVLERLRAAGVALAVATSSRRAIAEEYLINANVLKFFDILVCGDEVRNGKPDPEIFRRAAATLGCAPETCLMIEDSENGLLSASRAGGLPVYVRDIKAPRPEIRALAFRGYEEGMPGFLADLRPATRALPAPRLTEPFPATINDDTVGIHGFGAIGGGFLAQIFSHWDGYTRPREIIGVTGDAVQREAVNAFGKYTIRYGARAFDQTIDRVRLIDSADENAVCDMYARAAIIGLSMPEAAIRSQASLIARGLIARHRAEGGDLVILTIINRVGGAAFVRDAVARALQGLAPGAAEEILARTTFPETVINRIVTRLPREALLRQIRIKLRQVAQATRSTPPPLSALPEGLAEPVARLRAAADQTRALERLNLVLYHSEADMTVHAERGAPILDRLRQIEPVDNIHMIQLMKNRLWNGTHAIAAWYSGMLGHETIGQGMADRRVSELVETLIETEVAPALLAEFPAAEKVLPGFARTFMDRCRRSFRDPVRRVGRDPLRKLRRGERVLGTIEMARRHGIPTEALEFGAALGLLYALRGDPSADRESRAVQQVHARRLRIEDVLTRTEPLDGIAFPALDPVRDAGLIERIATHVANWPDAAREAV